MLKPVANFESTSYHGHDIRTTPNQLIKLAEKYDIEYDFNNTGEDKTNLDIEFMTKDGVVFTVYDWKEYKPLFMDVNYDFHIGAKSSYNAMKAQGELRKELINL